MDIKERTALRVSGADLRPMAKEIVTKEIDKGTNLKVFNILRGAGRKVKVLKDRDTKNKQPMRIQIEGIKMNFSAFREKSLEEMNTYTVVHVKKGKEIVKAKTSYEAAQKFAKMKRLKSTAGVDAHLMKESTMADRQVVRAMRIAKDMAGNMTGASKAIEKLKKGLSDHPKVQTALRTANESVELDESNLRKMDHDTFMKYGDENPKGRADSSWNAERKRRYKNSQQKNYRKMNKEDVELEEGEFTIKVPKGGVGGRDYVTKVSGKDRKSVVAKWRKENPKFKNDTIDVQQLATLKKKGDKYSFSKESVDLGEGLDARQIALLKKNYASIDRIDPSGPAYKKAKGMISGLDKDMQMDLAKAKVKFLSQIAADELRKQHGVKLKAKDYMESVEEAKEPALKSSDRKKAVKTYKDIRKGKYPGVKMAKEADDDKRDNDPCWDSHKMVGMKKKNGKEVPNCVPK